MVDISTWDKDLRFPTLAPPNQSVESTTPIPLGTMINYPSPPKPILGSHQGARSFSTSLPVTWGLVPFPQLIHLYFLCCKLLFMFDMTVMCTSECTLFSLVTHELIGHACNQRAKQVQILTLGKEKPLEIFKVTFRGGRQRSRVLTTVGPWWTNKISMETYCCFSFLENSISAISPSSSLPRI